MDLQILDDSRKWWKAKNHKGEVAHVPHTIVTKVNQQSSPEIYNNPLYAYRSRPVGGRGSNWGKNYCFLILGIVFG